MLEKVLKAQRESEKINFHSPDTFYKNICYNYCYNGKELILMGDIQKYYENTENALPHPMVKKFIDMNINPKYAIDLGCGTGRDTIYLIKNGWKVLSIDKENTKKIISSKLDNEELKNFNFECQDFENIELEKNNLLVANFSIPFCNKYYFNEFWNKISNSILRERILCWKLFWIKRFLGKDKRANGIFIKRTSIGII